MTELEKTNQRVRETLAREAALLGKEMVKVELSDEEDLLKSGNVSVSPIGLAAGSNIVAQAYSAGKLVVGVDGRVQWVVDIYSEIPRADFTNE